MTNITDNCLVFHDLKMVSNNNVFISSSCNNYICIFNCIIHFFNFKTFHSRLKCTNRIYLCNNNSSTSGLQRLCRTLSYITITSNNGNFPGNHYVCGASNTIHTRLSTAILVIKFRFRNRVIYIDCRHDQCAIVLSFM